jgi:microcystin-dependent protein
VPGTISNVGGSQPHSNQQPYLVLNFVIALTGIFPSRN